MEIMFIWSKNNIEGEVISSEKLEGKKIQHKITFRDKCRIGVVSKLSNDKTTVIQKAKGSDDVKELSVNESDETRALDTYLVEGVASSTSSSTRS